jgi:hypothetical protein
MQSSFRLGVAAESNRKKLATQAWSRMSGRIQYRAGGSTAWTPPLSSSHHLQVRVLAHIKKLGDCFGDFLVRVTCKCGAVREIKPEALARLVGWSTTLKALAPRLRCPQCGK